MKNELSILIPTYNDDCYELVSELVRQAEAIDGLCYEVIVADDASSMTRVLMQNRKVNDYPHCRLIENAVNRGRSAIRNFLAQRAQYAWLLFIDSDMSIVRPDYLTTYLNTTDEQQIVYGGYEVVGNEAELRQNLRYRYEMEHQKALTAEQRVLHPALDFHTSNFLIRRDIMTEHPLDERFQHYGYEDVLFGKTLTEAGFTIHHIDNPVGFSRFENNADFLKKTKEGLRTLCTFRTELQGYSRLQDFADLHPRLTAFVYWLYRHRRKAWLRNLQGNHPSLRLFKLYKLGYYAKLQQP